MHRLVGVPLEGRARATGTRCVIRAKPRSIRSNISKLFLRKSSRRAACSLPTPSSRKSSKRRGRANITSEKGVKVRASAAVVATNSPISESLYASHQNGTLPQLCHGVRDQGGRASRRALLGHARSLSLCALQPGDKQTDYIIVGGEDHKSGEADDAGRRFEALENGPEADTRARDGHA